MDKSTLLHFLHRPIAYQPIVAKAVGSVKLGILWSQLYYWSDKTKDADGWIYKTQAEIEDETALSRREQETARREGRQLGLIEERLSGNPARLFYKINIDRMLDLLEEYTENRTEAQQPAGKQIKACSSIAYLESIPEEDVNALIIKYNVTRDEIIARADDVLTYCNAKGKTYKNYNAALQNFIKTSRGKKEFTHAQKRVQAQHDGVDLGFDINI